MLYIVGTALGNIEDTSLRAAKTLSESDVILAEDTRHFHPYYKRILEIFDLEAKSDQKIISYHDQNEFKQIPYVLQMLGKNLVVSMVSDAGMPLFSDPGQKLVEEAKKKDIKLGVIPGPTAFTTALALSGFNYSATLFLGFLPKKTSAVKKAVQSVLEYSKSEKKLVIGFYESPHRILSTLQLLDELSPESEVCIARELTKKFEEVLIGKPYQLLDRDYKGEITVIVKLRT